MLNKFMIVCLPFSMNDNKLNVYLNIENGKMCKKFHRCLPVASLKIKMPN